MTFPAPIPPHPLSNPEANITVSRFGFLYGIAILAALPTHCGTDSRRIFREGYNYNREFASRRAGIMPAPGPGLRGAREGDGHGQMTKATPYQSRCQGRSLVNGCPCRHGREHPQLNGCGIGMGERSGGAASKRPPRARDRWRPIEARLRLRPANGGKQMTLAVAAAEAALSLFLMELLTRKF